MTELLFDDRAASGRFDDTDRMRCRDRSRPILRRIPDGDVWRLPHLQRHEDRRTRGTDGCFSRRGHCCGRAREDRSLGDDEASHQDDEERALKYVNNTTEDEVIHRCTLVFALLIPAACTSDPAPGGGGSDGAVAPADAGLGSLDAGGCDAGVASPEECRSAPVGEQINECFNQLQRCGTNSRQCQIEGAECRIVAGRLIAQCYACAGGCGSRIRAHDHVNGCEIVFLNCLEAASLPDDINMCAFKYSECTRTPPLCCLVGGECTP